MLREQLQQVRERISHACRRCGRDPSSVTLIGVTKNISAEVIGDAIRLGLADIGENRVQETQTKRAVLKAAEAVRWHLIGHLQRNKAKHAVELFDIIHSVDSLELANELDRQAARRAKRLEILMQVNVSGEVTKFGCRPEEAVELATTISKCLALRLIGLMTIAPFAENPEAARPHFHRLRELRDALNPTLKLSMGMSHDFEVAVEEGADFVRIGTAIFGKRQEIP